MLRVIEDSDVVDSNVSLLAIDDVDNRSVDVYYYCYIAIIYAVLR